MGLGSSDIGLVSEDSFTETIAVVIHRQRGTVGLRA